jgi:hypothetical protein
VYALGVCWWRYRVLGNLVSAVQEAHTCVAILAYCMHLCMQVQFSCVCMKLVKGVVSAADHGAEGANYTVCVTLRGTVCWWWWPVRKMCGAEAKMMCDEGSCLQAQLLVCAVCHAMCVRCMVLLPSLEAFGRCGPHHHKQYWVVSCDEARCVRAYGILQGRHNCTVILRRW